MDCQHTRTAIETASRFEPMGETAQRHLRSCNGCSEYAAEMSGLLSLLKSTPRVTAPADFDFRLRARIAEAQAKRRNPFSFLDGLRAMSFSWAQTATAMATVALAATLATFYFTRHTPTTPTASSDAMAKVAPAIKAEVAPQSSSGSANSPEIQHAVPNTVAFVPTSISHKNVGRNVGGKPIEQSDRQANIAEGQQIIIVERGGAKRMVTVQPYTYGAQPAANRPDNTLAKSQMIF